jgi:hypothetical protein
MTVHSCSVGEEGFVAVAVADHVNVHVNVCVDAHVIADT